MRAELIERALNAAANRRVLVIGDLMADEFLFGSVSRISPEAPVPVLEYRSHTIVAGGAGNAAANVASLGAKAALIAIIGADETGEQVSAVLEAAGVETSGVRRDAGRLTTRKTRIVAHSQQVVRIDRETREPIDEVAVPGILASLVRLLPETDAVLVADYEKGVVTQRLASAIIELCKEHACPVIVDTKKADARCFKGATMLTPNASEVRRMAALLDPSMLDRHDVVLSSLALELVDALQLDALVVTRAEEGMSVFRLGEDQVDFPALTSQVHDVTGAGDTVAAAIALATASGLSVAEAANFANVAAACVVRKVGTSTVTPDELVTFVESYSAEA